MPVLFFKKKPQKFYITVVIFAGFFLWMVDATDDLLHGSSWYHIALEGLILILACYGIIQILSRYFTASKMNIEMKNDLNTIRADLEKFKKETAHLTRGFSLKIDQQLEQWQMTVAEKEVAILLLKGLSIKEIADIRQTSEKTVSQQLSNIYAKSNLRSRSEFAAFFLEDLLAPVVN